MPQTTTTISRAATTSAETLKRAARASGRSAQSEATGGDPKSGSGRSAATALVIHREQVCQPGESIKLQRFQREATSSKWLIAHERTKAGLAAHANGVKATSPEWVRPPRPARCHWRASLAVGVELTKSGDHAYFSGVESCGSIWACPTCAAKKRAERANELKTAYQAIQADPDLHPGLFLTFTLRHNNTIALQTLLATIQKAYAQMRSTRAWRDLMERLGHVGIIRATEVTYSKANGWHPHFHCWLITDGRISNKALQAADAEITEMWVSAVTKATAGKAMVPNQERGCHISRVTSQGVAGYIAKTQESKTNSRTSIAYEMVRADLKTTRASNSVMPFEMLDPDSTMAAQWCEYVEATKGRRASAWSRGLKQRLGIMGTAKPERDPLDALEPSRLAYVISAQDYDAMTPEQRDQVLSDTVADPVVAAQTHGTPLDQLFSDGGFAILPPGASYSV